MYTDVPRCDASTSSGKFGSTKLVTSAMSVMRPVLGQGRYFYRRHIQLLIKDIIMTYVFISTFKNTHMQKHVFQALDKISSILGSNQGQMQSGGIQRK